MHTPEMERCTLHCTPKPKNHPKMEVFPLTKPVHQYGSYIQSLPRPSPAPDKARWRSEKLRPRPDTPVDEEILECMTDSLIAGAYRAQGQDFDPALLEEYPILFQPTPGRCLWTWDDLIHLDLVQDDPGLLDLTPLYNLAIRPSHEPIPPRLAAVSLCMNWAELHRAMAFVYPATDDYNDIHKVLSTSVYHVPHPGQVPLMPRIHPPRNSRRNPLQHYALQQFDVNDDLDNPSDHPLAEAITRWPPVEVDLGPTLARHWQAAQDRCRKYAKYGDDRPLLLRVRSMDFSSYIDDVLEAFVDGPWDLSPLDREVEPIREVKAALLWCLIQEVHGRPQTRYLRAGTLVPLSILSGVPLGSFIRWGLERYEQTGHPFVAENTIETCTLWVRDQIESAKTEQQAARARLMAEEMDEHFTRLLRMRDTVDATLQTNTHECLLAGGLPAWGVV